VNVVLFVVILGALLWLTWYVEQDDDWRKRR